MRHSETALLRTEDLDFCQQCLLRVLQVCAGHNEKEYSLTIQTVGEMTYVLMQAGVDVSLCLQFIEQCLQQQDEAILVKAA